MIISLVASKGGVGKTTSAVYLACAASRFDPSAPVRLLDADPQRSALDWADMAAEAGDPLPFAVEPADESSLAALDTSAGGLTIIDTAPGLNRMTGLVISKSDLVIIPAQPTPLDLRRAWKTLDQCDGRGAILVTRAVKGTTTYREAMDALRKDGASFLDHVVRNSVRYQAAFGRNPGKLRDYDEIWTEIREAMR